MHSSELLEKHREVNDSLELFVKDEARKWMKVEQIALKTLAVFKDAFLQLGMERAKNIICDPISFSHLEEIHSVTLAECPSIKFKTISEWIEYMKREMDTIRGEAELDKAKLQKKREFLEKKFQTPKDRGIGYLIILKDLQRFDVSREKYKEDLKNPQFHSWFLERWSQIESLLKESISEKKEILQKELGELESEESEEQVERICSEFKKKIEDRDKRLRFLVYQTKEVLNQIAINQKKKMQEGEEAHIVRPRRSREIRALRSIAALTIELSDFLTGIDSIEMTMKMSTMRISTLEQALEIPECRFDLGKVMKEILSKIYPDEQSIMPGSAHLYKNTLEMIKSLDFPDFPDFQHPLKEDIQEHSSKIQSGDQSIMQGSANLYTNVPEITKSMENIELQHPLEEVAEEMNSEIQVEDQFTRLEERQKSAEAIIQEKDLQIEQLNKDLAGFLSEVDRALSKISALSDRRSHQSEDILVKEEEEENDFGRRDGSLKDKIAEVQQKLEKAVFMTQETENELVEKDSEGRGEEDLITKLKAEIAQKDAELAKMKAFLGDNYVTREDHNAAMNQMQLKINEERNMYSNSINAIQEKVSEEALKFVKRKSADEEKDIQNNNLTKSKRKQSSLSQVSEARSVNGKRNIEDLLANSDENLRKKSPSKVRSQRRNFNGGKENSRDRSGKSLSQETILTEDKDDQELLAKKIKQN